MLVSLSPLTSEKVVKMSDMCGFDPAWVKKPTKTQTPNAAPSKAQPLPLTSAPVPLTIEDITDLPSQPDGKAPPPIPSAVFAPLVLEPTAQLPPPAVLAAAGILPGSRPLQRTSIQTRLIDLVKVTVPGVAAPLAPVPSEPGTSGVNAEEQHQARVAFRIAENRAKAIAKKAALAKASASVLAEPTGTMPAESPTAIAAGAAAPTPNVATTAAELTVPALAPPAMPAGSPTADTTEAAAPPPKAASDITAPMQNNVKIWGPDEEPLCSICQDLLKKDGVELTSMECMHTYHTDCIKDWMTASGLAFRYACPHKCFRDELHASQTIESDEETAPAAAGAKTALADANFRELFSIKGVSSIRRFVQTGKS